MADPGIWNQEPPEQLANLAKNFQKSFPGMYSNMRSEISD